MMLNGKTVLIAGGTGSFGKKMVQIILENYSPKKLIIFSRDELKQFEMSQRWSPRKYPCLRYFLGDVRDKERLIHAFHDVDYNKKTTRKTKIVIPVNFAGQSCDMESISRIVKEKEAELDKKIYIIEDACHALGSLYKNRKVGSCDFSDMVVMSFHPVKNITTGEGGVVLTNHEELYKRLRRFRNHGITNDSKEFMNFGLAFQNSKINPWYYEQIDLGFNYRITDIHCALGISQMKRIDSFIKRRREIVESYNNAFKNFDNIHTPFESSYSMSAFHLYVLLFDFDKIGKSRREIMEALKKNGVGTQVHYIPIYKHPYYQRLGYHGNDCPNAEAYYKKALSIPLFPMMDDKQVLFVIDEIKKVLDE